MSWIVVALIAGLCSNIFNIFNRAILREEDDSTVYGWITECIRLLVGCIMLIFDSSIVNVTEGLGYITLLGTVEVASVYVFMKMHLYSHLSLSTIIQRTRLIWVPVLAYILLGERLTGTDYTGIAILFLGLCISVAPRQILIDKGIKYAHCSAFVAAILSIIMKSASHAMSIGWVLIGMSLIPVLVLPLLMKNRTARIMQSFSKSLAYKSTASIANTLAMIFYTHAIKIGEVSKVSAIYQSMMIVSILAGIIFLNEKQDISKKLIGATVTLAGVLFLTLNN